MHRDLNKIFRVIRSCTTVEHIFVVNGMIALVAKKYPDKEIESFFSDHLKHQFDKIVYGYTNTEIN